MENIFKIWGERRRIHLDNKTEIDILYLKKDTFFSTHKHKNKINKFILISGGVIIESEYGDKILGVNESWVVRPPLKHRFVCTHDAIMIEMAYVEEGTIDPDDINRESLGGKIIDGDLLTIDDLKERGLLGL